MSSRSPAILNPPMQFMTSESHDQNREVQIKLTLRVPEAYPQQIDTYTSKH